METPTALFASCSNVPPKSIIKEMFKENELPVGKTLIQEITAYPWRIDTRYYTADILLSAVPSKTIGNKEFAEKVEAFIVHFDTSKIQSFEAVKMWLPFLNELGPEVRILLCDSCKEADEVSRLLAWQWCLDHSFELVELHPLESDPDTEENELAETTGIARVIEALHSHTWSNLAMKEKPTYRSDYMKEMMEEHTQEQASNQSDSSHQPCSENSSKCEMKQNVQVGESSSSTKRTSDCAQTATSHSSSCSQNKNNGCELNTETVLSASSDTSGQADSSENKSTEAKTRNKDDVIDSLIDEEKLAMLVGLGNEEQDEQSFQQLFQNLRLMKEKANALPLDQRKQYAEQVAVQFWKSIGGDMNEIDGLDSDLDGEDAG